jgi:phenylalanyl-tRNA synthetase alpha subunit
MCSVMQHTISIRTPKHRAKLLDARGVQQTSIGFFESSARGEAAYDGVKAAERAHDEAKAVENVANVRATGRLQILATCIDKLDSTLRLERQQYKQLIRNCRDNYMKRIKNIQDTGATDERAAATTAEDEHTAAMAAHASTQEALRVAREHAIAQRANTCGVIISA